MAGRRKMKKGVCHICKKNTDLSFEHIPPKCAFNKYTKYRTVPFTEYILNSNDEDYKSSAKIQQGGIGSYCLCRDCNTFLGQNYVQDYFKMAQVGRSVLQGHDFTQVFFKTINISPLKFFKQIISMFICINTPDFTEEHSELLNFVRDRNENFLPEKYRVFMYLNNLGQIRNLTSIYTNHYGFVNEITFPPFGFVLSFDPSIKFPLTEITHLKNNALEYEGVVDFRLFNLPTHLHYPIDYRTKQEIDETVKQNIKYSSKSNN